jgi:hypothetical protein
MTECLNCFGDKEIRLKIGMIDEPELEAFDEYEPDPSIVPLDYGALVGFYSKFGFVASKDDQDQMCRKANKQNQHCSIK